VTSEYERWEKFLREEISWGEETVGAVERPVPAGYSQASEACEDDGRS
jgi:hypothetical protein